MAEAAPAAASADVIFGVWGSISPQPSSCNHTSPNTTAAASQEHEEGAYTALRDITAYFGEAFEEADPSRVLRIVRDFLGLYEKALAELQARSRSAST